MSTTGRLCNSVRPDGEGVASIELPIRLVSSRTGATLVVCHMAIKKRRKASRVRVALRGGAIHANTLRISPGTVTRIKVKTKQAYCISTPSAVATTEDHQF